MMCDPLIVARLSNPNEVMTMENVNNMSVEQLEDLNDMSVEQGFDKHGVAILSVKRRNNAWRSC
jgi:hypothetical protein